MSYILKGTITNPDKIYGKSAYEIAVMHGFKGTEEEWVKATDLAKETTLECSTKAQYYANLADSAQKNAQTHETDARNWEREAFAHLQAAMEYATRAENAVSASQESEGDAERFQKAASDSAADASASATSARESAERAEAAAIAKTAYAYAQSSGYKGTETQFAEDINPNNMKADIAEAITDDVAEIVKAQVPLVKSAEQPTFVNSIDEMTDTSKVYVMPDGYFYGYREQENYNLLKLSRASYQSRLDNTSSEIVSSNTNNMVTDWFPVTPGKYYANSAYRSDLGVRITYAPSTMRVQLKLADGTIKIYTNTAGGNEYPYITFTDYDGTREAYVRGVDAENAVAMRIQFGVNNGEAETATKFKALQPMITEGDTPTEAIDKGLFLPYVDGDAETLAEWYNTGLAYNQPADYEGRVVAVETDMAGLQEDMRELGENMTNPASASPYYRDVNFGVLPFTYYQGLGDDYDSQGFVKNTKYADFIAKWKALVANHSGYVTEADHATASDGQEIYLYDFKPARIDNQDKPIPKILIVAGQHGFEKSNIYGLYYFVDNLLNRWTQHSSLEYIRNNVELLIVPVLNTYGFDNLEYKNKNGVNTNRNYDSGWVLEADTTSPQYGGAAPFDQPETQFVRKVLVNNPKTLLVIDFHTCGGRYVDNYYDVNWCGICYTDDSYYNRMKDSIAHHLSAITGRFNVDYALNQPNVMMGHMTATNGKGLLRGWATDNNFVGVLIEGFNGFPNDTEYVGKVYKANEEILVDYLITAMHYLGK